MAAENTQLIRAISYFSEKYRAAQDKEEFIQRIQTQFRGRYVPSISTLKKYGSENQMKTYGKVAEFLIEFQKEGPDDDIDNAVVTYNYVLKKMEFAHGEQTVLPHYQGFYDIFRRGQDGLINGVMEITKKGPLPWFTHSSKQDGIDYFHEGFVLFSLKRIFFIGIGRNYLRPIILKRVANPKRSALPGILFTEKTFGDDVLPMACKTVMFHRDLSHRGDIDRYLNNTSRIGGVIYGWERPTRRTSSAAQSNSA